MIEYKQIVKIPEFYLKQKIAEFLLEDIPDGDYTSDALVSEDSVSTAYLIAEEEIVFAGEQIIDVLFDETYKVGFYYRDSQIVPKGEMIAIFSGRTKHLLAVERVMLNLLQRLCGIATETKKYVDIASKSGTAILDTRKTTPGLRYFEKYAVFVGGGNNHRFDLSSGILIKDNHIKACGGVGEAVRQAKKNNPKNLPVEVEVESERELLEALDEGADGILIDNAPPERVAKFVEIIRSRPGGDKIFVEASGGITLSSLERYAETGVNAVSIGALTHSFKSASLRLDFI